MKFSILVGTYGSRIKDLDILFASIQRQTHKDFEVIVASQINHKEIEDLLKKYSFESKFVKATGKGPSNSRNATIKYATGDIATFSDDDCWYKDDAFENINKAFEKDNPAIGIFKHIDPEKNKSTRVYPNEKIKGLSRLEILKQITFDIYINTKVVPFKDLYFDERFGVAADYNSGEENIYLMNLYKLGFGSKMIFYPILTTYHPFKTCNYLDAKSVEGKGPLFKMLFGNVLGFFMILAFGLKKRKLILENNNSFWSIYGKSIKSFLSFKK